MDDLFPKLAEIFEVDAVSPDDVLQEFETWDSLTELSILAMLDSTCGVNMTARELRQFRTAGDLAAAVVNQVRQ